MPLFDDRIEAWVHGPVVPPVFGRFKHFRWNPIADFQRDVLLEGGHQGRPIQAHVEEVLNVYGDLNGPQLEALTHQESPWRQARAGLPNDAPSDQVISLEVMKSYYREKLQQAR